MFWVKKHEKVVGICDKDLLGRTLEQDDICLDVSEKFYKGQIKDKSEVLKLLKEHDNINIVGQNAIMVAKTNNLIADHKEINGIPYAMIFKV